MDLIGSDLQPVLAGMLEGFDCPAIVVSPDYQIIATNQRYRSAYGDLDTHAATAPRCYAVSHGYDRPCDQAGETCPLAAATESRQRERVLHIHQTPEGREHVDVEMLPIADETGDLRFFIELLRPLPTAGEPGREVQAMAGQSEAFNRMLSLIARVARSDAAVLLSGESGSGKELAAHTVHRNSQRSAGHMVTLECAGLTETLFESELFGHVRGAFTGANFQKPGLVEAASGGTLFLDEIGDVPLPLQVKLLRLIETGTYRRVGSTETRHADFRLVCATHKNLEAMVKSGDFREDLYYRINVFPIHVPALRERHEDIPVLAQRFLAQFSQGRALYMTESAVRRLREHAFPGNVRELRNIMQRACLLATSNVVDRSLVDAAISGTSLLGAKPAVALEGADQGPESLKAAERRHLEGLMAQYEGNKEKVAAAAGISLRSLYRKLSDAQH